MKNKNITCYTCKHYAPFGGTIIGGECRLQPPQIFYDPNLTLAYEYRWPVVDANEWCGQWQKQG